MEAAVLEEYLPQNVTVSVFFIGKHLSGSSEGNALELIATLTSYASVSL